MSRVGVWVNVEVVMVEEEGVNFVAVNVISAKCREVKCRGGMYCGKSVAAASIVGVNWRGNVAGVNATKVNLVVFQNTLRSCKHNQISLLIFA